MCSASALRLLFVLPCITAGLSHPSVGGISDVRFAANSGMYNDRGDGVLEVYYNGSWGTVCNYGFDELAASIACFMLGYSPRGIPILNSARRSELPVVLSNFNCTGKVLLPSENPSTATVHLGVCSFTDDIPEGCYSSDRQTSIFCQDPLPPLITTTPVPNYATIAPVDCSSPANPIIRLVGESDRAGRLEIQHPKTAEWGTVCADGFNTEVAKMFCRMLCTSADNLAFAYPVLYKFPAKNETIPIHLARVSCPRNASDLNECTLGGGWGAVTGCTHEMDIGLVCGPVEDPQEPVTYSPDLICNQSSAVVRYAKVSNPDLDATMIKLRGTVPSQCKFAVVETATHIEAHIPLEGCGGNLMLSNESMIAIRFEVIREYLAPESGLIYNLPIRFGVTCLIPRENRILTGPLTALEQLTDLFGDSRALTASLNLYRDAHFQMPLSQPLSIRCGEKVQARVSLPNSNASNKLILQDCWATTEPNRTSNPRQDLIVDRCAVYDGLTVVPLSHNEIGFSFPAFFLGTAGSVVPSQTNLYLHCDTRICRIAEDSSFCQQFCQAPKRRRFKRSGFRRSASLLRKDHILVQVKKGDIRTG